MSDVARTPVPQTINGYPVVGAIMDEEFSRSGVVVVYRPTQNDYVSWRVNYRREEDGSFTWVATSGLYDLEYQEAMSTMAYRAGRLLP